MQSAVNDLTKENQRLREALAESHVRLEHQEQQLNAQGDKISKLEELLLRQSVSMNNDMSTIQEISYVSQPYDQQVSQNDFSNLKSLFKEKTEPRILDLKERDEAEQDGEME